MRHKAAASLAQGYDPGSMLRTAGIIHKRGKMKWSKKQLLILASLKAIPIVERRAALENITDRQILASCGIYVPESNPDPSKPLHRAKRSRMGHTAGTKNLTRPLPQKAARKKYKPPKWKTGGVVRTKAHTTSISASPDPTESTRVNAVESNCAESDTKQEIRIFRRGRSIAFDALS